MTIKMNESADENVYVEFQHSKPKGIQLIEVVILFSEFFVAKTVWASSMRSNWSFASRRSSLCLKW